MMKTISNSFMITESLNPSEGDELVIRASADSIKDDFYVFKDGAWRLDGEVKEEPITIVVDELSEDPTPLPEKEVAPSPKKRTKKVKEE